MRWIGGRESENVEDRRGIGGVPAGIGGIGAIAVVLLGLFFGIMTCDPRPGSLGAEVAVQAMNAFGLGRLRRRLTGPSSRARGKLARSSIL